jgi:hypothetical protein
MSLQLLIQFLLDSLKFPILFLKSRDILISLFSELFILSLFSLSIFDALIEFSPSGIQLVAEFFDDSPLLFGLNAVLGPDSVKLVLLRVEFVLEGVDVLVELVDSIVVGFTVSLKRSGQGVDAFVEFLVILCSLVSLNF